MKGLKNSFVDVKQFFCLSVERVSNFGGELDSDVLCMLDLLPPGLELCILEV